MVNQREEKRILDDLYHDGAAFRARGISECIRMRAVTPRIVDALKKLKNDKVVLLGSSLSDLAVATLDIIGGEKYHGDDADVLNLIKGLPLTFS